MGLATFEKLAKKVSSSISGIVCVINNLVVYFEQFCFWLNRGPGGMQMKDANVHGGGNCQL